MKMQLLLLLAMTSTGFALPIATPGTTRLAQPSGILDEIRALVDFSHAPPSPTRMTVQEMKQMLQSEARTLNVGVINKVLTTLSCADEYNVNHSQVLTIIDYSLPSNVRRLWVFDLHKRKLLFHTYVSHGIKSGSLLSQYFSNKNNSKSSSIGVYRTDKAYYGRHGLSLKLDGLDYGFNDNAANRAVVMHGGWYVDDNFIKRYGRAGRSWGCPAVPSVLTDLIIHTIKENGLFVVYYPSDSWFAKSRFLHCPRLSPELAAVTQTKPLIEDNAPREDIVFVDRKKNNQHGDNDPVVVMAAAGYEEVFHTQAPLERMLRRQINGTEYIALSDTEFKSLVVNGNQEALNRLSFVIPEVKMVRGYYATEMKMVPLGKIRTVSLNNSTNQPAEKTSSYTVHFDSNAMVILHTTNRFIRWVGL